MAISIQTSSDTSHWVGEDGPSRFDLRSDTMTMPTEAMLKAVMNCTFDDDTIQEDQATLELEAHVARLTGKEAGLFVLSGIMGNQLGLRTNLTQPPHGVLCDHRSHIVRYEAGSTYMLSGAMAQSIVPSNGLYLTLQDIQANAVLDEDIHSCPTRVISLENTLNGVIMPLEEVRLISLFAQEHGIRMHCDGARLWEVAAAGAGTLPQFCELFDTVTMCFSKGLGAPVGSILVGTEAAMKHCRWVRRAIGGGLHKPGMLTASARVALDQVFGTKPDGSGGCLGGTHQLAKEVAKLWTARGGKLLYPGDTNMCWLDLDAVGCSAERFNQLGAESELRLDGQRLVFHYQILHNRVEALKRLQKLFTLVFSQKARETAETAEPCKKSKYQP